MNLMMTRRLNGKRKNSLAPASIALASMLLLAAGCGVQSNSSANTQNTAGSGIVDGSSDVGPDSAGEPVAEATPTPDKPDPGQKNDTPATQSQEQQGTGTFNGLADGHSAEIETKTDTIVFQAATEQMEQMKNFEFGDSVKFRYIVKEIESDTGSKVKQPWLISIEKQS